MVSNIAGMGRSLIVIESPTVVSSRLSNNLTGPRMMNVVNSAVAVELRNALLPESFIIPENADTQQAFTMHNCTIKLTNVVFDEPVCTSKFCNCIDCYDGGVKRKFCPCYAKTCSNHPVVAVMDIIVYPEGSDSDGLPVHWFTSKSVTEFFFRSGRISSGVRASTLNQWDILHNVRGCFDNLVDYINNGGDLTGSGYNEHDVCARSGWTVTGWVRRGKHKDEAIRMQTDGQSQKRVIGVTDTESSNLQYHIVDMQPSCLRHLARLDQLRFDSSALVQNSNRENRRIVRASRPTNASRGNDSPQEIPIRNPARSRPRARAQAAAAAAARGVVDASRVQPPVGAAQGSPRALNVQGAPNVGEAGESV